LRCSSHHPDQHSFPTRRSSDLLLDDQKRPMLDVAIPFCIVTVTDETGNTQKLEFYPTAWIDYQEEGALEQQVERYYTDKNDESIDRKSTRLNSSHVKISYAVFC